MFWRYRDIPELNGLSRVEILSLIQEAEKSSRATLKGFIYTIAIKMVFISAFTIMVVFTDSVLRHLDPRLTVMFTHSDNSFNPFAFIHIFSISLVAAVCVASLRALHITYSVWPWIQQHKSIDFTSGNSKE